MSRSRAAARGRLRNLLVACSFLWGAGQWTHCASKEPPYLDKVGTARGPLGVVLSEDGLAFRIVLGGKTIAEQRESQAVRIKAAYPSREAAKLVLLELATGGNACPGFYRVVEIREDGPARISEEFGNCNEVSKAEWDGTGWKIDIPAFGSGSLLHPQAAAQSWVYRDGKLSSLDGKAS